MALLYRAHFGFGAMRLANAVGEDTSVAYGLVGTMLNLLELAPPPTHLAVVFDAAGKTFRRVRRRWVPLGQPGQAVFAQALSRHSFAGTQQQGLHGLCTAGRCT